MDYDYLFLNVITEELQLPDINKFLESRKRNDTFIRQYLIFLLREEGLYLKRIGKIFDKDHTSILNAYKNHHKDAEFAEYIEIKNKIDNSKLINDFIKIIYRKKEEN
jgi:hypothetical protein